MKRLHRKREGFAFHNACILMLLILCLCCVIPVVLVFMASLTEESTLALNGYRFFPKRISSEAYEYLWARRSTILRCYGVSIFTTLVGTTLGVIITAMLAYPLSRPEIKCRNVIAFFVFFTMLFSGGVVSSYMIWTRVFGIKNSIWAYVFPNLLTCAFNVLLVRNYFTRSIPGEILEAAQIDGAPELTVFWRIVMPLSKPVITTIAIFTALVYWNDWVNGLYFISDGDLYSIQVYLNVLMNNIAYLKSGNMAGLEGVVLDLPSISIRMAIAVVAMLPILAVFPFIQRALIKGVVIGGVKG